MYKLVGGQIVDISHPDYIRQFQFDIVTTKMREYQYIAYNKYTGDIKYRVDYRSDVVHLKGDGAKQFIRSLPKQYRAFITMMNIE